MAGEPAVSLSRVTSSPFERANISFSRLLQGDPGSAVRALVKPESLAPGERQTLADSWGLKTDDWYGSIIRTITNPLVLIGTILAIRYPIPHAKEIFKFAPNLTGILRNPKLLRFTGNIDDIYAGLRAGRTTLPEAIKGLLRDVDGFRRLQGNRIGQAITKYEAAGHKFDEVAETLLPLRMQGWLEKGHLKPGRYSPAFERLVVDVNKSRDQIYDDVIGAIDRVALGQAAKERGLSRAQLGELVGKRGTFQAGTREAVDEALVKIAQRKKSLRASILDQLKQSGVDTTDFERARRRGDYFPWRIANTPQEFERQTERIVAASTKEAEFGDKIIGSAGRTPHAIERVGGMLPSPDHLERVKDYLAPSIKRIKVDGKQVELDLIPRIRARLREDPNLRTYGLDFSRVMSGYIHSMSRAFGWTVRGHGADIGDALNRLKGSGLPHNKVRAAMLENSYVPVALGRQTYKQMLQAAHWDGMRLDLVNNLKSGRLNKLLPTDVSSWFTDRLVEDRGLFTVRNIQGRLAGHFYLGALGANPVSSTWNMMQTLLTTIPVIGPKATLQGMSRVLEKTPKYFNARKGGLGHDEALARAFPEFGRSSIVGSPVVDEALTSALDTSWVRALRSPPPGAKAYDAVKQAMMGMFQASETFVRLTAFEGTMAKATKEGLSIAEAVPIARRVTEATQFLSGPANIPAIFVGSGPLIRQFGTFPLRYMSFLAGAATEMGSAAQRGGLFGLFPNRNLGTIGRAMLASGAAYEAGQEFLGQDLSHGLMFGALPSPPPGSSIPFPFVPPAVSLAAATAQGLFTGDFGPLLRQAPILIPGGVQAARMSVAYAPDVAEALGRQRADYERRLPDGRIPIYSSTGSLVEYLTPLQLHMKALGVPPGGPGAAQKELEFTRFVLGNRPRILSLYNEMYTALDANDVRRAMQVNEEYVRLYPGMGAMRVTKQGLRAIKLKRQVARLERILETLPADVRPLFGQLIETTLAQEAESLLGVDPGLLSMPGSTIAERTPARAQQPQPTGVIEALAERENRRQRGARPPVPFVIGSGFNAQPGTRRNQGGVSGSLGGRGAEPFSFGG